MSLTDQLLGPRLSSANERSEKIGVLAGIPILGLDGLSSAAYGPEAALSVLLPLGALGLVYIGPITLIILGLLTILYLSYRQTIKAYPSGGGSYTVARENLGERFGVLAAAALMLDYTLNVAVGISAGVGALISAMPSLHSHTLLICLVVLGILTLVNLRGVREAGLLFALPTYLFVGSLLIVIAIGLFRCFVSGGHPQAIVAPPAPPVALEGVTLWLLIRSFASGCTAMTGVEAVANGIRAFKEPAVENAQRTLTAIVVILGVLLAGIAYLSHAYGIVAMDETKAGYQSTLSQLAFAVIGRGTAYYITMAGVLTVLALSANTSYAGFPRLCRLVALDDYLPHAFMLLGRRLVYSFGIAFLTVLAGALLIAFDGVTDRLIPLFAVGAFTAFTLSQAGMVMHWRRNLAGGKANVALAVNGIGACATAVALVVILVAKFSAGAWVTLMIVPALVVLFLGIKKHYLWAAGQIRCPRPLELDNLKPPIVVVPIEGWNLVTEKALRFGLTLSSEVIAVHVNLPDGSSEDNGDDCDPAADLQRLRMQWQRDVVEPIRAAGLHEPRLILLPSPYRRIFAPVLDFIEQLSNENQDRQLAIIIPELVETKWWEVLLHNHVAEGLRGALLLQGRDRIVLINVPWI